MQWLAEELQIRKELQPLLRLTCNHFTNSRAFKDYEERIETTILALSHPAPEEKQVGQILLRNLLLDYHQQDLTWYQPSSLLLRQSVELARSEIRKSEKENHGVHTLPGQ